ncbi:hypothetical protein DMA15_10790 [Streptomyces sp. WAC 01529]|uniref:hypothetical protein n=1 Tax=Streptomyces sp. WAC 01529 TaxID=2203205 RepID=UPI000F6F85A0|nr:hypothetical protein [Streptomyces sp. WAC 01529]AZM53026.1 hypothetical protein DMA15_10790 [Streptomyces sp. WAC 01529]
MNVLIVIAILALVGLGFDQPLLWLAAAALVFYLVRFYDPGAPSTKNAPGPGGSTGATGAGGGGYPKTYRDYRLRKERQERWDRRYRRTHPGSGR